MRQHMPIVAARRRRRARLRRSPACAPSSPHRFSRPDRGIADRGDCAAAAGHRDLAERCGPDWCENKRMRSHISTASSMLCVTRMTPLIGSLPSPHRSRKSVRSVSAVSTSSAENGSSISRMLGCDDQRAGEADALAHAARQFARIGGFETVEADQIDGRQRALADLGLGQAERFQAELRHFPARSARETARSSGTPWRCPGAGPVDRRAEISDGRRPWRASGRR